MQELLSQLMEFLNSAWGVVEYLIDGLMNFVEIVASLPDRVLGFISFLPAEIIAGISAIITLVIAYKIVGRD